MEDTAVQEMDILKLECDTQIRGVFNEEELAALAATIAEGGILQPLLVRRDGDRFVVLDGERRLRAAKQAGLRRVPVIVRDREMAASEVLRTQLVIDCQKVHASAIDRARAIQALIEETQWSAAEVSRTSGLSQAQISKYLALLEASPDIQDQVARGDLAASTAYHITRVEDKEERARMADRASRGALTRDNAANTSRRRAKRKSQRDRSARAIPLAPGLSLVVRDANVTLDALATATEEFLVRVRNACTGGLTLDGFFNSIRTRQGDVQWKS